eukprot:jgi/Mesen1/3666/ME000202S02759
MGPRTDGAPACAVISGFAGEQCRPRHIHHPASPALPPPVPVPGLLPPVAPAAQAAAALVEVRVAADVDVIAQVAAVSLTIPDNGHVVRTVLDVMGICCPGEIPLIRCILEPMPGVAEVAVHVVLKTTVVMHDPLRTSELQMGAAAVGNVVDATQVLSVEGAERGQAGRQSAMRGHTKRAARWPSPHTLARGALLLLLLFHYLCAPLKYVSLAAISVGGPPMAIRALRSLRRFVVDIHTLMLVADACEYLQAPAGAVKTPVSTCAFFTSSEASWMLGTCAASQSPRLAGAVGLGDYVEAATVVFLFLLAKWLESRSSEKLLQEQRMRSARCHSSAAQEHAEQVVLKSCQVGPYQWGGSRAKSKCCKISKCTVPGVTSVVPKSLQSSCTDDAGEPPGVSLQAEPKIAQAGCCTSSNCGVPGVIQSVAKNIEVSSQTGAGKPPGGSLSAEQKSVGSCCSSSTCGTLAVAESEPKAAQSNCAGGAGKMPGGRLPAEQKSAGSCCKSSTSRMPAVASSEPEATQSTCMGGTRKLPGGHLPTEKKSGGSCCKSSTSEKPAIAFLEPKAAQSSCAGGAGKPPETKGPVAAAALVMRLRCPLGCAH